MGGSWRFDITNLLKLLSSHAALAIDGYAASRLTVMPNLEWMFGSQFHLSGSQSFISYPQCTVADIVPLDTMRSRLPRRKPLLRRKFDD